MPDTSISWPITTEAEFEVLMEQIDAKLRSENIAIRARPIKGWMDVSARFQLGLRMNPPEAEPIPGNYTGDDLTRRIHRWFKSRYGAQLNTDMSPGHTVAVIRGDAYRVVLPRVFGRVLMVCDPEHHGIDFYPNLGMRETPKFNILESIRDLQPALSRVLSDDELTQVFTHFRSALESFSVIDRVSKQGYLEPAMGDLRSSVDAILLQNPQYGGSRWHSLQAAEKFMKSYLVQRGANYPTGGSRGHDLHHLARLVQAQGLAALDPDSLNEASCRSAVRYGETPSTLGEAVISHRAALRICGAVAAGILRLPTA